MNKWVARLILIVTSEIEPFSCGLPQHGRLETCKQRICCERFFSSIAVFNRMVSVFIVKNIDLYIKDL